MIGLFQLDEKGEAEASAQFIDQLIDKAVKAEASRYRREVDGVLSRVRNGLELQEFLARAGTFVAVPEYPSVGDGDLPPQSNFAKVLWNAGLPNAFANTSTRWCAVVVNPNGVERLRATILPLPHERVASPKGPDDHDSVRLFQLLEMADLAPRVAARMLLRWDRSINPVGKPIVSVEAVFIEPEKVADMLQTRNPEYLVSLYERSQRRMKTRWLEEEKAIHLCQARGVFTLAPKSWNVSFTEGFDMEAFRLLILAAGIEFNPTDRTSDNHMLRPLSPAELAALRSVCERASRKELDLGAVARRAGVTEDEEKELTDPEGRMRFLVTEEVGPEVAAFLKKKPSKGKTLYLAACIGGERQATLEKVAAQG